MYTYSKPLMVSDVSGFLALGLGSGASGMVVVLEERVSFFRCPKTVQHPYQTDPQRDPNFENYRDRTL